MAKRNVLITGAGSGLGRGLSVCLARAGHSLIATDIRLESVQETVSQIKSSGGEAETHCLDVTSEPGIERFMQDDGPQCDRADDHHRWWLDGAMTSMLEAYRGRPTFAEAFLRRHEFHLCRRV